GHGLLSCRRSLADRLLLVISGRRPQTRTRRPSPWSRGPASSENYPTWIRGLLKDSTWFRQPSLCFSSLFRDLFDGFPDLSGATRLGTRRYLVRGLFDGPGSYFPDLPRGLGGILGDPSAFGCLSANGIGTLC